MPGWQSFRLNPNAFWKNLNQANPQEVVYTAGAAAGRGVNALPPNMNAESVANASSQSLRKRVF